MRSENHTSKCTLKLLSDSEFGQLGAIGKLGDLLELIVWCARPREARDRAFGLGAEVLDVHGQGRRLRGRLAKSRGEHRTAKLCICAPALM